MSGKVCEWCVGALFDSDHTKEALEEEKTLFRMLIAELNEVIDPGYRLKIILETTSIQEWQDALEKGSLDLCLMYCLYPACEQIILNTPRASYVQFVYIAGLFGSRFGKELKESDNFFEVELDVKGSIIKGLNDVGFGFHQITEKEAKMKKLTQSQKEIIRLFDHPYFTVDVIEKWLNGKTGVPTQQAMAVQFCSIKGFYEAVTAFEKNGQDYDYKILARGICIACGQIMEEDMNNAIDTVISILDSAGIDRAEAERCGVNKFDLERLEEAFCKMEAQE